WAMIGGVAVLSMLSGGLHLLAGLMLVTACAVYAGFFASLGLWFLIVSPNKLRATLLTLLTTLALCIGPSVVASLGDDYSSWLTRFETYGLAPPVTLWVLAFYSGDLSDTHELASQETIQVALLGALLYALAAWVLRQNSLRRFRKETNRKGSGVRGQGS